MKASKRIAIIAFLLSPWAIAQDTPETTLINGHNPEIIVLRGSRFRPLTWREMSAPQKIMVKHILAGARNGTLGGPFNILLRSPEMGDLAQQFGEQARFKAGLSTKQLELAIVMTARAWSAQFEWIAHKRSALQVGLKPSIVDAIAVGKRPAGMTEDEEVVYNVANELLYARAVSDDTFAAGGRALGERRLVNLVTVITYYELVSMLMVMDNYPLPDGVRPELDPIDLPALQDRISRALKPNGSAPVWNSFPEEQGPSYGQYLVTRGRFKPLTWAEMDPTQAALAHQLLESERKAVTGNYLALLRSPELGMIFEKFGAALPFRGEIPDRLRQLAILMIARHWTAQFEWFANHRASPRAGLGDDLIESIAQGKRPKSMDPEEAAVYGLLDELLGTRKVSDAAFRMAIDQLGERGVVNIVTLTGFFGMVSALMNLDLYPLPDGVKPELMRLPERAYK